MSFRLQVRNLGPTQDAGGLSYRVPSVRQPRSLLVQLVQQLAGRRVKALERVKRVRFSIGMEQLPKTNPQAQPSQFLRTLRLGGAFFVSSLQEDQLVLQPSRAQGSTRRGQQPLEDH